MGTSCIPKKLLGYFIAIISPLSQAQHTQCDESFLSKKEKTYIKSFVERANELTKNKGIHEATKELMSPKFIQKNSYIFVIDYQHHSLVNGGRPYFIGKDLKDIPEAKDSAQKIVETAKHGGGWVSYIWISPKTHQTTCKTSWVTPLLRDVKNNEIYTIGAGIEHHK